MADAPPTAAPEAPNPRYAADLLSVGRIAQITKQLQYAAASGFVSMKGKGRTRAPVCQSPEPSHRGGSNAHEEEVFDNVEDDDEDFRLLNGVFKSMEEEDDDDELFQS